MKANRKAQVMKLKQKIAQQKINNRHPKCQKIAAIVLVRDKNKALHVLLGIVPRKREAN